MALPSSGAISLKQIQTEFGGTGTLQSYGLAVLGRANCSLQEFYGKSNLLTYTPTFPPYPHSGTITSFSTPHGAFTFYTWSGESGGNNFQQINMTGMAGSAPWAKLIDLVIPWMGYTWTKAQLEAANYQNYWNDGNFSGGAITFRFYG